MPRVYRVEEEMTGSGPYWREHHKDVVRFVCSKMNTDAQPMPYEDGIPCDIISLAQECHLKYGFANITQMCNWFPIEALNFLSKYFFVVNVYSVPREFIYFGGHQVLFRMDEASYVGQVQNYSTYYT